MIQDFDSHFPLSNLLVGDEEKHQHRYGIVFTLETQTLTQTQTDKLSFIIHLLVR